ncbi:MAG: NAD-binding protein, partial [Casimicrobiaceae bacterium]
PRAAAKILAKDIGIAVALARRLGVEATFAEAAQAALAEAVAGGDGDADDAVLVRRALQKMQPRD